jgi:flagellar biosynthetic protein FlhB
MSSSAQDRTEKATPKRLQDARKKGQIPRSRELTTAVVVLAVATTVATQGGSISVQAGVFLRDYLAAMPGVLHSPSDSLRLAGRAFAQAFSIMAPVFWSGFLAALMAPMLVGGWNLAAQSLGFDFSRVNPLKGFGRLFSANSLVELGKGMMKVAVVGTIGTLLFLHDRERLLQLGVLPTAEALASGARLALDGLLWLGGGLLLIAAVDVPWQLVSHARQLRMSKQEIREESQQSEGKPEVKSRIRQLQHQMSRGRMAEAVPKADVIITNPTHYAVALQYAAGKDRAPRVIAKGADLIAQEIRKLAREHRVPLVEAPPLARALYRSCEIDAEVPMALYQAVAQVLSYVYQLRDWKNGERPSPPKVADDLPGGQV